MKNTLTTWQIADALKQDENAGWSYEGSKALAEYLDQLDQETGEDTELDVVAIRCDWSECKTAKDAAMQYGWEFEVEDGENDEGEFDDLIEQKALEYLKDRTQVIEFEGGIIVAQF
jgi:hypothetical protein